MKMILGKRLIGLYIFADIVSATTAWYIFYIFRKTIFETAKYGYSVPVELNLKFIVSLIGIGLFWILIYLFSGYYKTVVRKTYLFDISNAFVSSIIGLVFLFFIVILDDYIKDYNYYYYSIAILFILHLSITISLRFIVSFYKKILIVQKKLMFSAIAIGNGTKSLALIESDEIKKIGINVDSYIETNDNADKLFAVSKLGNIDQLMQIVEIKKPDDVIIAVEPEEHEKIRKIIDQIAHFDLNIKIVPELYEYLQAKTEISGLIGETLIGVPTNPMTDWEYNLKVIVDYVLSIVAIVIFAPLYIFIYLGVKFTSRGPALFKQERIGRYGRPFTLYKFRSMYIDAEKDGPGLSKKHDRRVTPFGGFLRKTKLDEIPNFFNVVKGDMSLVGPRPERRFYIDQIIKVAPNFRKLQKIKPGITSIGQVKYGYAENVDQMTRRLRYDLIYLENMSILTDLRVILFTIRLLFKGRHI